MFLLRSAFWLGLALVVIQPHNFDLAGSAGRIGATAMETGRAAALDGLDQVACTTLECAGAKLVAKSALTTPAQQGVRVNGAPYPAPPLARGNI